jgi:hypothetical protein
VIRLPRSHRLLDFGVATFSPAAIMATTKKEWSRNVRSAGQWGFAASDFLSPDALDPTVRRGSPSSLDFEDKSQKKGTGRSRLETRDSRLGNSGFEKRRAIAAMIASLTRT